MMLTRRSPAMGLVFLALVAAGCTKSSPGREPTTSQTLSPVPSSSPTAIPRSDIRFLLDDSYTIGDRVAVQIENVGDVAYRYQALYQACFLSYLDSKGREFLIPPGTHCDIRAIVTIQPGQTKRLFMWDLDECIKDQWGCVKSGPLEPGTYTIRGTFRPVAGGRPARAEVTFEIQPSY
jgi:hypothetical protein